VALAVLGLVALAAVYVVATRPGEAGQAADAASGVIISTASLGDGGAMVTLVDVARQRMVMYVADAKRSRLKLLAARDISADWALVDFNNDPPLPKDIRARTEKTSETPRPPAAPAAEEKPGGATTP